MAIRSVALLLVLITLGAVSSASAQCFGRNEAGTRLDVAVQI